MTIRPHCFVIIIANHHIDVSSKNDVGGGLKRRAWMVKTGPRPPSGEVDIEMEAKILQDIDAIASKAVLTAVEYIKNPNIIREMDADKFYSDMNGERGFDLDSAIKSFVETQIIYTDDSHDFIYVDKLYEAFMQNFSNVAKSNNLQMNGFAARLKRYLTPYIRQKINGRAAVLRFRIKDGDVASSKKHYGSGDEWFG